MNESEMVERVAAALCCHKGECQMRSLAGTCCKSEHYASARAAIEAMREPTAGMCNAGADDLDNYDVLSPVTTPHTAAGIWRAMIFAALSPTGRGGGAG